MVKKEDYELSTLNPQFRTKIKELLETIMSSISALYQEATHDEKTGLYNNKFFSNILDMEIEKTKRGLEKLCLIMIDIDYFKKINDTYGHLQADKLLIQIGKILQKNVRKSDVAARFGGEEFMLLLTETPLEEAKQIAKRIKEDIHGDSLLKRHNVTVSGGITEYRHKKDSKQKFLQRADDALHKAKNSGRDNFQVIK